MADIATDVGVSEVEAVMCVTWLKEKQYIHLWVLEKVNSYSKGLKKPLTLQ